MLAVVLAGATVQSAVRLKYSSETGGLAAIWLACWSAKCNHILKATFHFMQQVSTQVREAKLAWAFLTFCVKAKLVAEHPIHDLHSWDEPTLEMYLDPAMLPCFTSPSKQYLHTRLRCR